MRATRVSEQAFAQARTVIPGGVNSPVRSFASVGGTPFFVESGEGAYLVDVDGNRYLDYVQSWGASILGHAHPAVLGAIADTVRRGTTFGAPTLDEVRLVEAITEARLEVDEARLVCSGTEAVMTAVRLARGATGRDVLVKFAGCYHGHSDALLAHAGSGLADLGLPASAGVPQGAVATTRVERFNTVPELDETVAAVIVEPVAANMGLVAPVDGFLEGLRAACDEVGALLILDEVITGFRLGRGGAAARFGVRPDLVCLGKILGGGLPLAAVGGRRDLLELLAPTGPVYQAGTLSGNPLATAAGLAVLGELDEAAYLRLEAMVARLTNGIEAALVDAGLAATVPIVGTLNGVFFDAAPVRDYDGARRAAASGIYRRFFHELLERGVFFPPSPYEAIFCSLAHGEAEIDATIEAVHLAAHATRAGASGSAPAS